MSLGDMMLTSVLNSERAIAFCWRDWSFLGSRRASLDGSARGISMADHVSGCMSGSGGALSSGGAAGRCWCSTPTRRDAVSL